MMINVMIIAKMAGGIVSPVGRQHCHSARRGQTMSRITFIGENYTIQILTITFKQFEVFLDFHAI